MTRAPLPQKVRHAAAVCRRYPTRAVYLLLCQIKQKKIKKTCSKSVSSWSASQKMLFFASDH